MKDKIETSKRPAAYLVTDGRLYVDKPFLSLEQAEASVKERQDGAVIVPLYRGE